MHHNFDDSDGGSDDSDTKPPRTFGVSGYKGRIIFLGDGTEVLTDSDDTEMIDNAEEDKDLVSQVDKSGSGAQDTISESPLSNGLELAEQALREHDAPEKAKVSEEAAQAPEVPAEAAIKHDPESGPKADRDGGDVDMEEVK